MQMENHSGRIQHAARESSAPNQPRFRSFQNPISIKPRPTVDMGQIGGDEGKLFKHYGLTPKELATVERTSPKSIRSSTKKSNWLVRPSESLEDIRQHRMNQSPTLNGSIIRQPRSPPSADNTILPPKRDTRKFSIRNVFGRGSEQSHTSPPRARVLPTSNTISDRPASKNVPNMQPQPHEGENLLSFDGSETKRGLLPASKRRIAIENRRYSPINVTPALPAEDDLTAQPGFLTGLPSVEEHKPVGSTRSRSATVKRVVSGDAKSDYHSRRSGLILDSDSFLDVGADTRNRGQVHQQLPVDIGHEYAESDDLPTPHDSVLQSSPITEGFSKAKTPERLHSNHSRNTSDGRQTLIQGSEEKEFVDEEPQQARNSLAVANWMHVTAPRQAMEAMSFFARLNELEARMESIEQSIAQFHGNGQLSRQSARESTHITDANTKEFLSIPPNTQSLLTPPCSQLNGELRTGADTWLRETSSISSFADSVTASSPWPSSRTSTDCLKRSPVLPVGTNFSHTKHLINPDTTGADSKPAVTEQMYIMRSGMADDGGTQRESPLNSSSPHAGPLLSISEEAEALRSELAGLYVDAAKPYSVFGKFATQMTSLQIREDDTFFVGNGGGRNEADEREAVDEAIPGEYTLRNPKRHSSTYSMARSETSWFYDEATESRKNSMAESPTWGLKKAWRRSMPVGGRY